MKKIISKILVLVFIISVISTAFSFTANAASAIIAFNKSSYSVGDTITVTITVKGSNMSGADLLIEYNQANIKFLSGDATGGAGQLHIVTELDRLKTKSFSIKFKALKNSSSLISVSGAVSDGPSGTLPEDKSVGASANIKIQDVAKSSNANLKSLRLDGGNISPAFSANTTTYTLNIPNSVTKCLVYATCADSGATLEVEGTSTMKVGHNVRKVIVTAPSGATKTYTINIYRADEEASTDTPETPNENPLITQIDGVEHIISTDISNIELFSGFNAETVDYKGVDVPVAVDDNYTIYYLSTTDSDVLKPYTYDSENDEFLPLAYLLQGENDYIFSEFPSNTLDKSVYFAKNLVINDYNVKAYVSDNEKLTDFYYVYAYKNGEYSVYRYDALENVLQRCPDYVYIPTVVKDNDNGNEDFIDRFNKLTSNAKIVVITLLGAILVSVALIILLIVKLATKTKYKDELAEAEVYNPIAFDDNFVIKSNNKPNTKQ